MSKKAVKKSESADSRIRRALRVRRDRRKRDWDRRDDESGEKPTNLSNPLDY